VKGGVRPRPCGAKARGALMVELAMTIAVLGVLAMISFGTFGDVESGRRTRDAANAVRAARQAVLDFARVHGRLPCPDLSGSGGEGDASGACPPGANFGRLPAHALGLEDAVLPGTQALRYGVARPTPDSDLSSRAPASEPDAARRFMALAERAAGLGAVAGQPYIPAVDAAGRATDCATQDSRPAFVISAGDVEHLGDSSCFPVPPGDHGALAAMGRLELVGWIRSNL
jgi:type II secretory pathway pseudopilin PulG